MHINNSRATKFAECPASYYYAYGYKGKGLTRPFEASYFTFGHIWHDTLAAYHTHGFTAGLRVLRQLIKERITDNENYYSQFGTKKKPHPKSTDAQVLHTAYEKYRKYDFKDGTVNGTKAEVEVKAPLDDHNTFVCRIDLENEDELLGTTFTDHKTAKGAGSTYIESWEYSPQMIGYAWALGQQRGTKVAGYVVNVFKKLVGLIKELDPFVTCGECKGTKKRMGSCEKCNFTGKVPRKNTSSEEPFLRIHCGTSEHKTAIWKDWINEIVSQIQFYDGMMKTTIQHSDGAPHAYPRNLNQCFNQGKCPWLNICWGEYEAPHNRLNPPPEVLHDYDLRDDDYVTQMQKEEME